MTRTEMNYKAVRYKTEKVESLDVFHREAGDPSQPAILMLHGVPASSHEYRDVLSSDLTCRSCSSETCRRQRFIVCLNGFMNVSHGSMS